MAERFATEVLDLPSQGWFYPEGNPLTSGQIEIRYMGAKEEDILTSRNLIKKGVAIDMVLRNVIVSPINYDDLLIGDKNAIMVATRILGYGKDYEIQITCPSCEHKQKEVVDLSVLEHNKVTFDKYPKGTNEFTFQLPISKHTLTFKFLQSRDEDEITKEVEGLKKINEKYTPDLSTRLKKIITSVDGKRDASTINNFVDSALIAGDSLALRRYIASIMPGIDMTFDFKCSNPECDYKEHIAIPMTVEFFWPGGNG